MALDIYIYYVFTIIILTTTPGPNVLLSITTTIKYDFKLSIYSSLGGFMATSIIFTLSFLGLGALILSSSFLFLIVKYMGAFYLIYLGYKAITSKQNDFKFEKNSKISQNKFKTFKSGFLVGFSNPKAIVFFTALFPQFINIHENLLTQFIILYSTFTFFELFLLFAYSYSASKSKKFFLKKNRAKIFNKLTGGVFIGAGSYLALK